MDYLSVSVTQFFKIQGGIWYLRNKYWIRCSGMAVHLCVSMCTFPEPKMPFTLFIYLKKFQSFQDTKIIHGFLFKESLLDPSRSWSPGLGDAFAPFHITLHTYHTVLNLFFFCFEIIQLIDNLRQTLIQTIYCSSLPGHSKNHQKQ